MLQDTPFVKPYYLCLLSAICLRGLEELGNEEVFD